MDIFDSLDDRIAPKELYEKRLSICKECPEFRSSISQCSICNCFMEIKCRIKGVSCPDKPPRW